MVVFDSDMQEKQTVWNLLIQGSNFSKKGLQIVSPSHLLYDYSRKIFLMLYSINRPNFIVWFPLLPKISPYMSIVTVCFPVCDIKILKLPFLIMLFSYITKSQNKYLNISRTKTTLRWNRKYFHHFLRVFSYQLLVTKQYKNRLAPFFKNRLHLPKGFKAKRQG